MKLEELKFVCIAGTMDRARELILAANRKGANIDFEAKTKGPVINCYGDNLWGFDSLRQISDNPNHSFYSRNHLKIVPLQQALDLIAQVEEPEPEKVFDIKPFDKVIARYDHDGASNWIVDFFSNLIRDRFWLIGDEYPPTCVAKYEGNEHLNGKENDYPEGWWECKNGKPVWVKRG